MNFKDLFICMLIQRVIKEYLLESTSKERLEALWKRGEPHITKYTNEQKTEITNIYNNKLATL